MNKLESAVIVNNPKGSVATLRFADSKDDKILSVTGVSEKNKNTLYTLVEKHVKEVTT